MNTQFIYSSLILIGGIFVVYVGVRGLLRSGKGNVNQEAKVGGAVAINIVIIAAGLGMAALVTLGQGLIGKLTGTS